MEKKRNFSLLKIGDKSHLFVDQDGNRYRASKRVANEILNGCENIFIQEVTLSSGVTQHWLATPSRFN